MEKSRLLAAKAGDRYFRTGKLCAQNHDSKRFTLNGTCYECNVVSQKRHRDKIKSILKEAKAKRER